MRPKRRCWRGFRLTPPLPFRGGAGGGACKRSPTMQATTDSPTPTPPLQGRGFFCFCYSKIHPNPLRQRAVRFAIRGT
ncbi:hypothetical protein ENE74_03775 [Sphingobium algorifonticola]|uniref:Uncharacterized protein n=1 Tax=Sphingobium algorifonticola TaxID=2008318 RepID=A0A437JDG0_9SPHN|nr:hypothetical protein ENE74_03775 [Sphingobium algorifonticola]